MAKVIWNDRLPQLIKATTDKLQHDVAERLAELTRQNIIDNNQVRTGFMGASVYTVTPQGSTYDRAWADGEYTDVKSGQTEERAKAPEATPQQGGSLMGVAADYALQPELETSYAFRSVDLIASELPGLIADAAKGNLT